MLYNNVPIPHKRRSEKAEKNGIRRMFFRKRKKNIIPIQTTIIPNACASVIEMSWKNGTGKVKNSDIRSRLGRTRRSVSKKIKGEMKKRRISAGAIDAANACDRLAPIMRKARNIIEEVAIPNAILMLFVLKKESILV
jgi:hypothetical protein